MLIYPRVGGSGNNTLQRSRIFGLVLFIRGVTDQDRKGDLLGRDSWEQEQEEIPGSVQNN